ncbi:hypothetical protein MXD81_53685 [Microbacteriaceae bacterium K1510]|nr:hypothetical protein [Microbacteriaceae bacterium K1510]
MRWDPYQLHFGDQFDAFWSERLKDGSRKLLFLVGGGFDGRATIVPKRILGLGKVESLHGWILRYQNGQTDSEKTQQRIAGNLKAFSAIFGAEVAELEIKMRGSGNSHVTSRNTRTAVTRLVELEKYTDVVVDISAMPRTVGLTAIAQLIALLDEIEKKSKLCLNLHVVVAESASADRTHVGGSLSDTVMSLAGFSGQLTSESSRNVPRVWFPVLGEGQAARLERIRDIIEPDEICPTIPFPSRDPLRGDRLVEEYRQLLFDDFRVEPANIIYTSEYNPFEAYRQLWRAIDRYRDALRELGGCKVFVSPLSSKLLSVGALLACYDHRAHAGGADKVNVGIPYVESVTYGEPGDGPPPALEVYSLWIRGDWER